MRPTKPCINRPVSQCTGIFSSDFGYWIVDTSRRGGAAAGSPRHALTAQSPRHDGCEIGMPAAAVGCRIAGRGGAAAGSPGAPSRPRAQDTMVVKLECLLLLWGAGWPEGAELLQGAPGAPSRPRAQDTMVVILECLLLLWGAGLPEGAELLHEAQARLYGSESHPSPSPSEPGVVKTVIQGSRIPVNQPSLPSVATGMSNSCIKGVDRNECKLYTVHDTACSTS
eukprot:1158764-Pelagomonas_calceolata.AAC.3